MTNRMIFLTMIAAASSGYLLAATVNTVTSVTAMRTDLHALQNSVGVNRSLVDYAITTQRDHELDVNFPSRSAVSAVKQ